MAISLILRVAILIFLFLGGLFAILATTGKKWQKYEEKENFPVCYNGPTEKTEYCAGLWDFCYSRSISYQKYTVCAPINSQSNVLKSSITGSYVLS